MAVTALNALLIVRACVAPDPGLGLARSGRHTIETLENTTRRASPRAVGGGTTCSAEESQALSSSEESDDEAKAFNEAVDRGMAAMGDESWGGAIDARAPRYPRTSR